MNAERSGDEQFPQLDRREILRLIGLAAVAGFGLIHERRSPS
jgi:hypothetical protein